MVKVEGISSSKVRRDKKTQGVKPQKITVDKTKQVGIMTDELRVANQTRLQKAFGPNPLESLADARKNYENALKSGSLENILEASKKLTEAQKALTPNAAATKVVSIGSPVMEKAQKGLLKAQMDYEKAAKANNIDKMISAQKKLAEARVKAGLADVKKPIVEEFTESAPKASIWKVIKAHPIVSGAVVLAVAAGIYFATRKNETAVPEAV